MTAREYRKGDRVEYIAAPVFDGIIETGDLGIVLRVEDGWVFARWADGVHSVPVGNVRFATPWTAPEVTEKANEAVWSFIGEPSPPLDTEVPRDPYWEQGCHPDIVAGLWDHLGRSLPADCRAQAKGRPVLAHPQSHRIFAVACGTAYALWLIEKDYARALELGTKTAQKWAGGQVTELRETLGPGWVWGEGHRDEPAWMVRAYLSLTPRPGPAGELRGSHSPRRRGGQC